MKQFNLVLNRKKLKQKNVTNFNRRKFKEFRPLSREIKKRKKEENYSRGFNLKFNTFR
jgi:hypothetical protein